MNAKKFSWVLAVALVISLASAAQVYAAADAFLTIVGTKQGAIKGETTGAGAGKISISDFSYSATAPMDKNTGMSAGKRMHSTFTIHKTVDSASPKLMQAMHTGEVLSSVDLQFYHPGPKGPDVYKTLHLTNAVITSIEVTGKTEAVTFTAETENVQAMTTKGGKTAMDDWMSQN